MEPTKDPGSLDSIWLYLFQYAYASSDASANAKIALFIHLSLTSQEWPWYRQSSKTVTPGGWEANCTFSEGRSMVHVTDRDRWLLGRLLVDLDQSLNGLDVAVFEAVYDPATHRGLDSQRDLAMSDSFQPAVKKQRDRALEYRNSIARMLGFPERRATHDFAPRGYIVEPGEFLRASAP